MIGRYDSSRVVIESVRNGIRGVASEWGVDAITRERVIGASIEYSAIRNVYIASITFLNHGRCDKYIHAAALNGNGSYSFDIVTAIAHAAVDGMRDAALFLVVEKHAKLYRELRERAGECGLSAEDVQESARKIDIEEWRETALINRLIDYDVIAGRAMAAIQHMIAGRHLTTGIEDRRRAGALPMPAIHVDERPPKPKTRQEVRGRALLLRHLTKEQRETYLEFGRFDVVGGITGRTYTIRHGTHINIYPHGMADEFGKPVRVMCFVPKGGLCSYDVMLAQAVALECMEDEALKVANTFQ